MCDYQDFTNKSKIISNEHFLLVSWCSSTTREKDTERYSSLCAFSPSHWPLVDVGSTNKISRARVKPFDHLIMFIVSWAALIYTRSHPLIGRRALVKVQLPMRGRERV